MAHYHLLLPALPLFGAVACIAAGRLGGRTVTRSITVAALLVTAVVALVALTSLNHNTVFDNMSGTLAVDRLGLLGAGMCVLFALIGVAGATASTAWLEPHLAEFHALLLTATAGGVLMVMSVELVTIAVGLTLLAMSLVSMAALAKRETAAVLAAQRQLMWAGASLVVVLLGAVLLYAVSSTTIISGPQSITASLGPSRGHIALAGAGFALLLVGLGSWIGLPPLNVGWLDLLEAAPPAVAGTLASLGVVAGWIPLSRIMAAGLFSDHPAVAGALGGAGQGGVAGLAAVATLFGTYRAVRAATLRGLLASLVEVQSGLLLMAILATQQLQSRVPAAPQGAVAGLLLLAVAGVTFAGVFAVIGAAEYAGYVDRSTLAGLSRRRPLLAGALALGVASAAGAPPLAGFLAHLLVWQASMVAGFAWLVLVTMASALILLIPCLRTVSLLYVDAPGPPTERVVFASPVADVLLGAYCAVVAGLVLAAGPLAAMAAAAGGASGAR